MASKLNTPTWWWALPLAALFAATAWLSLALTWHLGGIATLWVCNGLLIGVLLLLAANRGPVLGACLLANIVVNLLAGYSPLIACLLALANMVEVLLALQAVRGRLGSIETFIGLAQLRRFALHALVLAPAVAAALYAAILSLNDAAGMLGNFLARYRADALGIAVMVPLVVALHPDSLKQSFSSGRWLTDMLAMLLLAAITVLVFWQSTYPFLFMLAPPLLWVTFRLGFTGAACGTFVVAAIALGFTLGEMGPFTLVRSASPDGRIIALQMLMFTLIVTTYPVCAVIISQRSLLSRIAGSEERFRVIAENSSDIVALTDVNGIWRYMSPAVDASFGWTAEEMIGKNGLDFVHPEDAALYARGSDKLSSGRDTLTGVFRMRHRDGHYVWVETISRLLRDPTTGKPTGWVSNSRDISARRRIEQMKDEFVSTVNHELRTPLTAMLGAIGLAMSGRFGEVSEQLHRLLTIVRTNGERLSALVNDILDFEKVSSGNMRFDLQPCRVQVLLEQSVQENLPYANEHGVILEIKRLDQDMAIRVDRGRFQQVMANLLSNAAKFSYRGGRVQIEAARRGNGCCIAVIDHGVGIPAAFRNSLFDRFAQADGTDQRAKGGTGLGMAIAKHMTERMHGRISFESEEQVGTTFYLEFPLIDQATGSGVDTKSSAHA